MGTIKIRVDESLTEVFERIRKEIAEDIKRKYGLDEITISGTATSKLVAARMRGMSSVNFKINKVGMNKGVLELL